jgi:hypothetical protein
MLKLALISRFTVESQCHDMRGLSAARITCRSLVAAESSQNFGTLDKILIEVSHISTGQRPDS